mmetsp:Transcript_2745/g.4126  ORF Transcript_2745/g.4126 Transcript_2745/m.4126 type:complete len:219 (+) Transcript_2745:37-693(+)
MDSPKTSSLDHNTISVSVSPPKYHTNTSDDKSRQDDTKHTYKDSYKDDRLDHWSTTENGALMARATSFIYRKIIASELEGGLKNFFEENCQIFLNSEGEQQLDYMDLYRDYERHIDRFLDEFAKHEELTAVEVSHRLQDAVQGNRAAAKNLEMLLAASEYSKFVSMMRRKAREIQKQKDQEAVAAAKVTTTNRREEDSQKLSNKSDKDDDSEVETYYK